LTGRWAELDEVGGGRERDGEPAAANPTSSPAAAGSELLLARDHQIQEGAEGETAC